MQQRSDCALIGEFGTVRRDGAITPCRKCGAPRSLARTRLCSRCTRNREKRRLAKRHDLEEQLERAQHLREATQAAASLADYWPEWQARRDRLRWLDTQFRAYWDTVAV